MNIKKNIPHIITLWLFIFSCFPALILLAMSFMTNDFQLIAKLPLTFEHYEKLLSSIFLKISFRSFLLGGMTTLMCLIIAYPFSYFLLQLKNKTIMIILIIIPFWTSSLIRTFAMVDILKNHGILNKLLLYFHIRQTPLNILYTNFSVILGLIYNLLPFMILPIFNAMETIDFKCIEAARDLGASKKQIFFKIFWPQSQNGVINGCIMVFLPAMTLFFIPNILGGSKSLLLGNLIQNQFLFLNDWPQGAASSTFLTVLLMILFYLTQSRGLKK